MNNNRFYVSLLAHVCFITVVPTLCQFGTCILNDVVVPAVSIWDMHTLLCSLEPWKWNNVVAFRPFRRINRLSSLAYDPSPLSAVHHVGKEQIRCRMMITVPTEHRTEDLVVPWLSRDVYDCSQVYCLYTVAMESLNSARLGLCVAVTLVK